ncbi:hypothetical protein B0H10DRAFT_1958866 [Mycena sp. CBHHK59/15]|nr:hypothetical protein B0H10DRAFT_1958866 [Mycena sp. CBHHK59/15]
MHDCQIERKKTVPPDISPRAPTLLRAGVFKLDGGGLTPPPISYPPDPHDAPPRSLCSRAHGAVLEWRVRVLPSREAVSLAGRYLSPTSNLRSARGRRAKPTRNHMTGTAQSWSRFSDLPPHRNTAVFVRRAHPPEPPRISQTAGALPSDTRLRPIFSHGTADVGDISVSRNSLRQVLRGRAKWAATRR